jgi:mannose-6-phosphate isomerase-like protein (cupin superfamily)
MSKHVIAAGEGKSVRLGGLGVIFKLLGADTNGLFSVVEHPLDAGALGAPPHTHHNEDEYSYILEGEVTVMLGDEVITAGPGTLIAKPRGLIHTFWNATTEPAKILEIIAPAGFEKYFEEAAELAASGAPPDDPRRTGLSQKYHIDFERDRIPELVKKYNLKMMGPPK